MNTLLLKRAVSDSTELECLLRELVNLDTAPRLVRESLGIAIKALESAREHMIAAEEYLAHLDPEHFGVIVGNGEIVEEITHEKP